MLKGQAGVRGPYCEHYDMFSQQPTLSVCPVSVARHAPLGMAHTRTEQSSDAVATCASIRT